MSYMSFKERLKAKPPLKPNDHLLDRNVDPNTISKTGTYSMNFNIDKERTPRPIER